MLVLFMQGRKDAGLAVFRLHESWNGLCIYAPAIGLEQHDYEPQNEHRNIGKT